jgi:hypothetical protein
MTRKGKFLNVYRVLILEEIHGRPSGLCERVLNLILNNFISFIKKILNWLRDFSFVAEKCSSAMLL